MQKFKLWLYHVLIGFDQFLNAIFGGHADETFSSRCHRGAVLAKEPKKRWRVWCCVVNTLFLDKNHCKTAYESEVNRKQFPPEFQELK